MRIKRTLLVWGALGLALAVLLLWYWGKAEAQTPVPVIHACYTVPSGQLYFIRLPGLPSTCRPGDREVVFPAQGPRGPKGDPGPPGPQGPAGAPGGPVNSIAACSPNSSSYGCSSTCGGASRVLVYAHGRPCTVTSETGSCSAGNQGDTYEGSCCVCLP